MERISALMDGELDREEMVRLVPDIKRSEELREAWTTYHLIGDALRRQSCSEHEVMQRVVTQLQSEPTVLAPHRTAGHFARRFVMPSFAAAAAIAVVTWMSLETQQAPGTLPGGIADTHLTTPITAQHPGGLAEMAQPAAFTQPQPAIELATRSIDAYLLAHQEFSPSTSIHGLAPYVRMVTANPANQGR